MAIIAIAGACVAPGSVAHPSPSASRPGDGSCADLSSRTRLQSPGGGVYFGVNLDWGQDSPASLSGRLGRHPALFEDEIRYCTRASSWAFGSCENVPGMTFFGKPGAT